jgi:hypothetical protein
MTTLRVALGVGVAAVGVVIALLFSGGTIPPCLGPVGGPAITIVRCANATGIMPTVGTWLPLALVALALGAQVVVPPRATRHAMLGGIGLVVGSAWYLVTRPKVLEGPDYDGAWLSLPMPVELDALIAWALAGGLIGLLIASVWPRAARLTRVTQLPE